MVRNFFVAAAILLSTLTANAHPVVIDRDLGGDVATYNDRWKSYAAHQTPVVIKGWCVSACARFMTLPNVCAQPGAVFMLHGLTDASDRVRYASGRRDSLQWESAAAVALQDKYRVYGFGIERYTPRLITTVLERGVSIYYHTPFAVKGRLYTQKFLRVDATRLVPACQPQRSLNSNASAGLTK